MQLRVFLILSALCGLFLFSCGSRSGALEVGIWRATLTTDTGAEIPFNFQVSDSAGQKLVTILNGDERLRVDEIGFEEDTLVITMPLFDSEIRAVNNGQGLAGYWIKRLADRNAVMPFKATPDVSWRFFEADAKSDIQAAGRWSVEFISEGGVDTTIAVAEFAQNGSRLTGTFLTPTGDFRFLEGSVSANKIYLSSFDGGNAYLFTAQLANDSTVTAGKFYSGSSAVSTWTARRDEKAALPDAYGLTALKKGASRISFTFPNLQGQMVSPSDERFQNKVVLVQFLGSWCPNCMDETAYLVPFYEKYKDRGLEIIGLAYERTADKERSLRNVNRLKQRFSIPYDLLLTGYTNDKPEVARSIPELQNFIAFPTLVIIDKKGIVRKIHTGFAGPGTGEHYRRFTVEFEKFINDLLAEK